MKKFVISPDVVNILGADPKSNAPISVKQPKPQPKPQKSSLWKRVGGFFKKVYAAVITPVLNVINAVSGLLNSVTGAINAVANFGCARKRAQGA